MGRQDFDWFVCFQIGKPISGLTGQNEENAIDYESVWGRVPAHAYHDPSHTIPSHKERFLRKLLGDGFLWKFSGLVYLQQKDESERSKAAEERGAAAPGRVSCANAENQLMAPADDHLAAYLPVTGVG